MIDVSSFFMEREWLRRFCFRQTTAVVVVRDVTSGSKDHRNKLVENIVELLLFLLTVDAERFADPNDGCDDFSPSVFAVPRLPIRGRDVTAALDGHHGLMPFVVDQRVGEVIWPLLPTYCAATDILRHQVKLWDRGFRQRRRIGGFITADGAADGIAVLCDGSRVLRRNDGTTLDIGAGFWRAAAAAIASQRCLRAEEH